LVPVLTDTRHEGYYAVAACLLGGILLGIRAIGVVFSVVTVVGLADLASGHSSALAFVPVACLTLSVPVSVGALIRGLAHRPRG
jgi:hypothetical protein